MRVLKISLALLVFILSFHACDGVNDISNDNQVISAEVSWTQDVTSINMIEVGVKKTEISQNAICELQVGKGRIYWVSNGVEYFKDIKVGDSDSEHEGENSDDDIECEQEGENEGENEGCVFTFSFSGNALTIVKR